MKILVAITGASGALYAQRLLDNLDSRAHEVHVVLSNYAQQVIAEELPGGLRLPAGVKHPQMQWNLLDRRPGVDSALLAGQPESPWVYFVHSFAPELTDDTTATCEYGASVTAAAERGPLWGTQFHPEKSGQVGLGILANFVRRVAAS